MIYAVQIHDTLGDKYQVWSSDDLFSTIKEAIAEIENPNVSEVHLLFIKETSDA